MLSLSADACATFWMCYKVYIMLKLMCLWSHGYANLIPKTLKLQSLMDVRNFLFALQLLEDWPLSMEKAKKKDAFNTK
uniref:Secreted protein n=1 Tax=Panagrellus redivivus TaxID=6233 RepID=A0A7E4VQ05_PANRE